MWTAALPWPTGIMLTGWACCVDATVVVAVVVAVATVGVEVRSCDPIDPNIPWDRGMSWPVAALYTIVGIPDGNTEGAATWGWFSIVAGATGVTVSDAWIVNVFGVALSALLLSLDLGGVGTPFLLISTTCGWIWMVCGGFTGWWSYGNRTRTLWIWCRRVVRILLLWYNVTSLKSRHVGNVLHW